MNRVQAESSWKQLAGELRPYVRRRVASDTDTDDVLQDILLRMHKGLPALSDTDRFGAWTYRVARSTVIDHLRAKQRDRLDLEPDVVEEAPDATEAEEENEVAARLAQALSVFVAQLPSPYREAITLTELEGRTQKEAAQMVGVSVSAMKSRVQRGRAKLRAMLEECCAIALDARGGVAACVPKEPPKALDGCCT